MDAAATWRFPYAKIMFVAFDGESAISSAQFRAARHHNVGAMLIHHFFGNERAFAGRFKPRVAEPLIIFFDSHAVAPAKMAAMLTGECLCRNLNGYCHCWN